MRKLYDLDWLPLALGLAGALLVLALASPQAQASQRLLQTVPTPTPRVVPTPAGIVPPSGPPAPDSSGEESASSKGLGLWQTVSPHDVLPGEEVEFSLRITNTLAVAVTGIVLVDALDSILTPLEVKATQGAVRFEDGAAFVDMGTLEPGHSALLILRARVGAEARPGRIILNQITAHYDDTIKSSNIVAAGLPPNALPATGRAGRGP